MTEAFLQYIWQHRLLRGDLTTTEGLLVIVERSGEHNHDAGPDFFDARVSIGGLLWAGNVEVHVKASDWNLHGHTGDTKYDNVILHVVYTHDIDIILSNGKVIPTLDVSQFIPDDIWEGYAALMQPQLPIEIPCMLQLAEVPNVLINSYLDRLTVERVERKATDVLRLVEESKGHWETCCYWMLARYFGGKVNAFVFEMLAKMTPQNYLAKIKDNPTRVEALLMGQAGFLEGELHDEYPLTLQKEYRYLRKAYDLTPIEGHLWKFFRLRPANFPTIRISQLANLIAHSENLFSKLLETPQVVDLRKLFDVEASPYWNTHYRFDHESEWHKCSVGGIFIDILLINAWVPLLFEYGVQHGSQAHKDQAINILQQLPPESNRITRLWSTVGIIAQNGAQSQAELQLYNEYCKNRNCLNCQIGYQVLVKSKSKPSREILFSKRNGQPQTAPLGTPCWEDTPPTTSSVPEKNEDG